LPLFALLALARGQTEAAIVLARQAADAFATTGHRLDAARARLLLGRALAAQDSQEESLAELERARAELEQCGAARHRDQAIRELRRLGRRIGSGGHRAKAATGLGSLSRRELEVATLVTERLTNRGIAERLVLSEKTVERHMSSIFRKLDVSTRVDVARAVERERAVAH
jgi:DNA-binding NarL/FixJ family response regulator